MLSCTQNITKYGEKYCICWCRFAHMKVPFYYHFIIIVGACFLILGGDKQSQKTKYVKICPLILNRFQQHGLMHLDLSSCPLLLKTSDTTWELRMGLMCISARVQVCYNISFICNMSCFIACPIQTGRDKHTSRQRHVEIQFHVQR